MQTETQTKIPIWHSMELDEIHRRLNNDMEQGLSENQAAVRQKTWGKNILPEGKKTTVFQMVLRQFASPLVYILLIAAVLTWWLKEYVDMSVILTVVGINAVIGLFQEYRANKIFEKLKAIVRVTALVTRNGKLKSLDSTELVPGDIILLKTGSKVPADARVISATGLAVNEALLTGESKASKKSPGKVKPKSMVGDRFNMVFMGTILEEGEGQAVVVATGARTEIGQITLLTQKTETEKSPLQIRIGRLGGFITKVFVAISVIIFVLGLLEGRSLVEMIKTTIAVAVAAIPEGLPAAISVILAVSSQRILRRKGLVMRLVAAETLGSTSVISTDKTGTLTFGKMKVEKILTEDKKRTLLAMALANEAVIEEQKGTVQVRGEATDKAKLESFLNAGGELQQVLDSMPRQALVQFHPSRKYIASFHKSKTGTRVFVSGAPEVIIQLSTLPKQKAAALKKSYEGLAARGYRLIALAEKKLPTAPFKTYSQKKLAGLVKDLDYLGLAAIRDPIRPEVRKALRTTRQAGIKILMITGDHILTAKAIAKELGFRDKPGSIITGLELDELSDEELDERIGQFEVIARATPEHKMRIIKAWQQAGAVVAMTGDGVNDAPALKSANIGIAVGSGTDVSKEASDLILLDDSFATITAAVREGRTSFSNIRKATVTVMANGFTELTLIASSLAFGVPFPITAVQILWVNIVTDSLPVLSLAFEPAEKEIMKRKPLPTEEPILDRKSKMIILVVGILADFVLVGIFLYLLKTAGWELVKIQSFIFFAIAAPTLVNVFAYKSLREPLHRINLTSNRFMLVAVAIGFLTMLAALYIPALNTFLGTTPLSTAAILTVMLFAGFKLSLVELVKWWYRGP